MLILCQSMLEIISPAEPHVTINGYSVDIYLPQFSLAFEFQGKQHYVPHKRGSLKQYEYLISFTYKLLTCMCVDKQKEIKGKEQ
jgi:hypothetical protein